MHKTFFAILMLASYALLLGCGTQGPLYIPEQRYPQKTQDDAAKKPDVAATKQTATQ